MVIDLFASVMVIDIHDIIEYQIIKLNSIMRFVYYIFVWSKKKSSKFDNLSTEKFTKIYVDIKGIQNVYKPMFIFGPNNIRSIY